MAELKTRPTTASVSAFIDALPDPQRRTECRQLVTLMSRVTGAKPVLWGTSIVGFGSYRYVYASGTSGDWPLTGFAPRARDLTLYLMDGFEQRAAALKQLGPHKSGKCCLYVKSLADVDLTRLEEMVADSVKAMRLRYPSAGGAMPAKASSGNASKKTRSAPAARTTAADKATTRRVGAARTAKTPAGKQAGQTGKPALSARR